MAEALPLLLCALAAFAVEKLLHRFDRIFLPTWRPAVAALTALTAWIVWLVWTDMTPMERILQYGGDNAKTLAGSAIAFLSAVGLFLLYLAVTSLRTILEENRLGNRSVSVLVLRILPLAAALLLAVRCALAGNALVGENGFAALVSF